MRPATATRSNPTRARVANEHAAWRLPGHYALIDRHSFRSCLVCKQPVEQLLNRCADVVLAAGRVHECRDTRSIRVSPYVGESDQTALLFRYIAADYHHHEHGFTKLVIGGRRTVSVQAFKPADRLNRRGQTEMSRLRKFMPVECPSHVLAQVALKIVSRRLRV